MSPPHRPALSDEGYLFQLPSLGLPDPAGEWVRLRCAIGDHKTCALLLKGSSSSNPLDLIKPDSKQDVVEAELEGAVWSFPLLSSSPPSASRPKSKAGPKLLNVYVKRQSASSYASSSRAQERTKLPDGITLVFLNRTTKRFEYKTPLSLGGSDAKKRESEDSRQDLSISNAPLNVQTLTNSAASTSEARAGRRRAHLSMDAATVRAMIQRGKRARAEAHESWESRINAGVNNRLLQMQQDDTAVSLPQFVPSSEWINFSGSQKRNAGIGAIDEASSREKEFTTWRLARLLPMPVSAALSRWFRGVSDSGVGTKSVATRQWPPRPTAARKKLRGKRKEELGGWWRDGGTPKAFVTRLVLALTLLYLFAVCAHPVGSAVD